MYTYHVTAHKSTAVTHSLVGNFTGPSDVNLIVARNTRLEIFKVGADGLTAFLDVGIYGRIANMDIFRPRGEKQDLIFLTTEKYKFCVLAFDAKRGEVITRANGDLEDKMGRPNDNGQLGMVDPECRMIGLHLYNGLFKIIPMDAKGSMTEAYNVRLEEASVLDMRFLYGTKNPTVALLYQDARESRHVKTFEINLRDKEFQQGPFNLPNVEGGASILIALPKPFGGVVVVGEQTIIYHNGQTMRSLIMKPNVMKTWGRIDSNYSRILLGDHIGRLWILQLINDGTNVSELKLELIGETVTASCIKYIDNAVVFVGSRYGDSQLLRLLTEPNPEYGDQYLEVIQTFTNIGPIVDFTVVDLDRQGQGQVVTCSGAYKDGSLRVVRNGIGIDEHAVVDLPGVKGVFSLTPPEGADFQKYLVVTFVGETRVFGMSGEEMEQTDRSGLNLNGQTIYCTNMGAGAFLQVLNSGIYLINATSHQLVDSWTPPQGGKVTTVASNASQILVAVGRSLFLFDFDGTKLIPVKSIEMAHEIGCLSINPLGTSDRAALAAVGLWGDMSVRIVKVPSLEEITREVLEPGIIPRSVMLITFEGIHYLFAALGDGSLFTFGFDPDTVELTGRKKVTLGTHPVTLHKFTKEGRSNIFACSDRPTVIYSNNQKILFSNVNLKEVTSMSEFNSEAFPDSLALVTEQSLIIGTIDDIQKLHIQTIPLNEMPRRISYFQDARAYCVLTVRFETDDNGDELEHNFVRLYDETTFEPLDSHKLETYENGVSLISLKLGGGDTTYYVVGTAFAIPSEGEPDRGRLLVFQVHDGKLNLVAETEVKGAVYALEAFNGKVLAGINSKVSLYRWVENGDGSFDLKLVCDHTGHVLALYLASRGDFFIVGDLMKSITLLVYKPVDERIDEIARDYSPHWMTAAEIADADNYIGAENSYNLITVRKNLEATTDEDRARLEPGGCFHVGEFVNRFRHGSLVMKAPESEVGSMRLPTILYGTVSGAIGILASIPKELYDSLVLVQAQLLKTIKGVGGFDHAHWRAFHTERRIVPAKNFIDGDLIEQYLDLSSTLQDSVAQALNTTSAELIAQIEALSQALH